MHPEFFRTALAQAASHAHNTAPVYHSLLFGVVVAIVGGFILSLLFSRASN